jgi:hypothetical protein
MYIVETHQNVSRKFRDRCVAIQSHKKYISTSTCNFNSAEHHSICTKWQKLVVAMTVWGFVVLCLSCSNSDCSWAWVPECVGRKTGPLFRRLLESKRRNPVCLNSHSIDIHRFIFIDEKWWPAIINYRVSGPATAVARRVHVCHSIRHWLALATWCDFLTYSSLSDFRAFSEIHCYGTGHPQCSQTRAPKLVDAMLPMHQDMHAW